MNSEKVRFEENKHKGGTIINPRWGLERERERSLSLYIYIYIYIHNMCIHIYIYIYNEYY